MSTRLVLAIVSTLVWEALLLGAGLLLLPAMGIELSLLALVMLMVALGALGVISYRVGSAVLRKKPIVGLPSMVGGRGKVVSPLAPRGTVLIKGELWQAMSSGGSIGVGEEITVLGEDGLRLIVERVKRPDD